MKGLHLMDAWTVGHFSETSSQLLPSDACLVPVRFKNTAAHLLVPLIECQPRRMRGDFLDPNFCFHRLSSSGKLPSERISRGRLQRGSISPSFKWLKDLPNVKPHPEEVFENSQKRPESIRCVIRSERVADDGLHRRSRSTGTTIPNGTRHFTQIIGK